MKTIKNIVLFPVHLVKGIFIFAIFIFAGLMYYIAIRLCNLR